MIKNGRFLLNKDNIKLSFLADGKGGYIEILLMGTKEDLNNVKKQLIEDQKLRELLEYWKNTCYGLNKASLEYNIQQILEDSKK